MKILYIFAIIQQISKFLQHLLVSLCYTSVTSSCHLFLTCFFPLFVCSEVRLLEKNLNKQLWKKYCKQSHEINHRKNIVDIVMRLTKIGFSIERFTADFSQSSSIEWPIFVFKFWNNYSYCRFDLLILTSLVRRS